MFYFCLDTSRRGKRKLSFLRAATACRPLTLPPNKHPYLFSLGHIAAEATGPCQKETSTYWWRLSPGQRSRVKTGGGSRAAEQRSGKETGSLVGSVWAPLRRQASSLIEYLSRFRLGWDFIKSAYFLLFWVGVMVKHHDSAALAPIFRNKKLNSPLQRRCHLMCLRWEMESRYRFPGLNGFLPNYKKRVAVNHGNLCF